MKPPQPNAASPGVVAAIPRRGRDRRFGRVIFLPPLLVNPRAIFDPAPFRTQRMAGWVPAVLPRSP